MASRSFTTCTNSSGVFPGVRLGIDRVQRLLHFPRPAASLGSCRNVRRKLQVDWRDVVLLHKFCDLVGLIQITLQFVADFFYGFPSRSRSRELRGQLTSIDLPSNAFPASGARSWKSVCSC